MTVDAPKAKLQPNSQPMRVSKIKVNQYLEKELFRTLHQTLADLKTPEEVNSFLDAFLTTSEHATIAKRLAVAYWLDKKRSYDHIQENLKVSSATIATVQSSMKKEGVKIALQHIKAEEWASVWAQKIQGFLGKHKTTIDKKKR